MRTWHDGTIGRRPVLTRRQTEVIRLVAEGLDQEQICARLWLADGTVRRHKHDIRERLGVHSTAAAVDAARERGILP